MKLIKFLTLAMVLCFAVWQLVPVPQQKSLEDLHVPSEFYMPKLTGPNYAPGGPSTEPNVIQIPKAKEHLTRAERSERYWNTIIAEMKDHYNRQ